jgi:hypothetical protein
MAGNGTYLIPAGVLVTLVSKDTSDGSRQQNSLPAMKILD